jgi:plastocyanin
MRAFAVTAAIAVAMAAAVYLYIAYVSSTKPESIANSAGRPLVAEASTSQDAYDTLVRFDGEVFEPNELTIKTGTRVRFLNESEVEVWPASAIHPTHSIYPEKSASDCLGSSFDSCRPILRGEFFAFTFNAPGEWRYHDHVRAYKTGVVTVTE